jgi:high affinity Mn2+ porin
MPWLGRFAASLALGLRKRRQAGWGFVNERLFECRSVSCVARASLADGIQRHRPRSAFQLRMICNKAWQRVGPPFDQTFDRNIWRSGQTRQDRQLHFISLMAVRRHGCSDDKTDRRDVRARYMPSMSRHSRPLTRAFAGAGLGVIVLASPAGAADMALKAPALKAVYDWTGFYFGGHFGYGGGSLGAGTNPIPEQGVLLPTSVTGLIGGYQMGYNRQFANHVVLGIEADSTFTSPVDGPALGRMPPAAFNTTLDYIGTVRGRIGYAFGTWLPYLTGGLAWGHTHVNINSDPAGAGSDIISSVGHYQPGWTAGLGVEFAVGGNWSAKVEYDYVGLSRQMYDLSGFLLPNVNVDPRISFAKIGLNYHFGDTPWKPAVSAQAALPESTDWNIHGQTTFLPQGYPAIHALYTGPDSLPPGGQLQETWTSTAFLGVRLWEGGEFYFNPELA